MDGWDYLLKFSPELLVTGLVLCVLAYNALALHPKINSDVSFANRVLKYHASANPSMYNRALGIKTLIEDRPTLISQVEAKQAIAASRSVSEGLVINEANNANENSLVQPTPDSIQNLITNQIHTYQTKPGDTLSQIAEKYRVSPQTIIWSNHLSGNSLKAGQELRIPPVDGTLHTVGNNDTLPDIAKTYHVSMESIISYNGLQNAEDIEPSEVLIIKGGTVTLPSAKHIEGRVKGVRSKAATGGYEAPTPADVDFGTGHEFPWGYCTYYVSTRRHIPWGGNAKQWLVNAKAAGAVISKQPTAGAIMVSKAGRWGHVAMVESVSQTHFKVTEMNYIKHGVVNDREITIGSGEYDGFILP